jgi:hypothetical protein
MTKRIQPHAIRACLFGGLLALLAGCNGDDQKDASKSTFPDVEPPIADNTKVPPKPVVGIVTEVPDTKPKPPVTTGGEAIPLPPDHVDGPQPVIDNVPGQIGQAIDVDKLPPTNEANRGSPEHLADDHREGPSVEEPDLLKNHDDIRVRVGRFTEIAPDTIGGATFSSSPAYEYNLGNLVAVASSDSATFGNGVTMITPMHGWMRYPMDAMSPFATKTYPVVIFLHGAHSSADPSYKGYDYLAEHLATHGYVVLSIDANAINALMPGTSTRADPSSQTRAQLMLGTLDRLRQVNEQGHINPDRTPGALDVLKGKLDFSRIGIMGHSRGGQGVANTILFNLSRHSTTRADLIPALAASKERFSAYPDLGGSITGSSVDEAKLEAAINKYNIFFASGSGNADILPPYDFKGAFLLAPTDFGGNTGLNKVPLAVLLPSCDGDMRNLQGAVSYDHNRFGPDGDLAPRYQIMVNGANHNDYNTVWTGDDFAYRSDIRRFPGPNYCKRDVNQKDSIRLSDEDQRRNGLFIVNSFMRYHVGGEEKFATYWNGMAQLPSVVCPSGYGSCDERMVLSVQKADGRRKLIQRFELANSLETNLLGGATIFSGFNEIARCATPSGPTAGTCSPKRLSGFEFDEWGYIGLRSIADHVELGWSQPAAGTLPVERAIITDLNALSTKGFDSVTFRIAVVRPMGQEVLVTLTDRVGKSATVTASEFTNALYNAPRRKAEDGPLKDDPTMDIPLMDHKDDAPYASGEVKTLLNMVAIPLAAFEGIDTTSLKGLKLVFPKESGKVAITDIELQNLGYDELSCELASPKPAHCLKSPQTADISTPLTNAAPKDRLLLINE